MAIDYGTKRVGLAVTDVLQMIATPLDTVPTGLLMGYLKTYLGREQVDGFVIGEPLQMDASISESEKYIRPFIQQLGKEFPGIEISRMDERFTSKMASRVILESGIGKMARRDKSLVDKVSAAIILQSYLEQREIRNSMNR